MQGCFPRLKKILGAEFSVVLWPDESSKKFHVLPLRWIVERSFSWLESFRRFAMDYEFYSDTGEAMVQLAFCRQVFAELHPALNPRPARRWPVIWNYENSSRHRIQTTNLHFICRKSYFRFSVTNVYSNKQILLKNVESIQTRPPVSICWSSRRRCSVPKRVFSFAKLRIQDNFDNLPFKFKQFLNH